MKKILNAILLASVAVLATGCNKQRDIKEMLQDKGLKCISISKADSLYCTYDDVTDKEFRFHELEMRIDSIIKSIPTKFNYAYEEKIDKEIEPIAAACYSLKTEIIDESIKKSYASKDEKQEFIGMYFRVKMSVYGKVDEYWVRTNKDVNKILYIAPTGKNDYYIMFRKGIFGTLR